jgi:cellulose synthase/poly-beta-1,6-N-acetylglucosamine synthase-like glycosyltransferase
MVIGPVRIETDETFFSKIQAIEFSSLIGSGAATLEFGVPTMCNGANLAFRKDVFNEVNGYDGNEKIASGDDEFLLRKISARHSIGISFNNSPDSIVSTGPQKALSQFISQRLRWAGKWKHHRDSKSKILALSVFVFHVMVLSLPILFAVQVMSGFQVLSLLASKFMLEFIFLSSVTSWLGIRWNWLSFLLLQLIYPIYAIYIGLTSLFFNPSWKGRK